MSCCYFGGNGHFGTGLRRFAVLGFRFSAYNWVACYVIAVMFNDPNKRSLVRSFSYRTHFAVYAFCTGYSLGKFHTLHTLPSHTLHIYHALHASHSKPFAKINSTRFAHYMLPSFHLTRKLHLLRTLNASRTLCASHALLASTHALPTRHALHTTQLAHLRHFSQSSRFAHSTGSAHFTRSTHSYSRTLHTPRILAPNTHGLLFVATDTRN